MEDGSKLTLLFPLEIMCFSDLLSSRKNKADQGMGKLHSLVCSTSFILQTTAGCRAFPWKPREGTAHIADIGPEKTDIQCRCWLKIKEQRKKDQRITEDKSGTLHACTPHVCIWLREFFSNRIPPQVSFILPYCQHTPQKNRLQALLSHFSLCQLHHSQYSHWKTGGPQPGPEAPSVSFVAWPQ